MCIPPKLTSVWTNAAEGRRNSTPAVCDSRGKSGLFQVQWELSLDFMVRHTHTHTHTQRHTHARAGTYQKHKLSQTHIWQVLAESILSAHSFHSAHCGLARLNRRVVGRDVISRRLYGGWLTDRHPARGRQHKLSLSLHVRVTKTVHLSGYMLGLSQYEKVLSSFNRNYVN